MILQCDQCNTKFRLDDSKIKPGGVKVRCSKCRHVFIAGAEAKQEESDFDAILSGLGAPTAEERGEEAPAQEQPTAASPAQAVFKAEPEPAPTPAAAKAENAGPVAPAAASAAESAPGQVSESEVADFSAFDFSPEPAPQPDQGPAAPVEAAAPGTPEEHDVNAFDFSSPEEPTLSKEAEAATPSQGLDYGEFAFMEEPAAPEEAPASAPGEALDFGELAFSNEPAPAVEGKPAAPEAALDFGEFEFNPEPTVAAQKPQGAPDLDFGDFAFEEEPAVQPAAKPADQQASKDEFDFGDFSFSEEPPPLKETPASEESSGFGEFESHEEPQQKEEEGTKAPSGDLFALGDLSFGEEKEAPSSSTDFSLPEEMPASAEFELPGAKGDLGEFSFGKEETATPLSFPEQNEDISAAGKEEPFIGRESDDTASTAGVAAAMGAAAIGAGAAAAAAAGKKGAPEQGAAAAPETQPTTAGRMESATPLDFSFGAKSEAMGGVEEGYEEEELPPLSISSRRKGRSVVTVAVVAVAVVVILALTGAGLYLLQSGPAAVQKFDKIGLGFVGKWFGVETPEEGKIEILKPLASFYQNKEAGELFVVTGDAVNHFKKARASIHVKVTLFDKKGAVLMQKTAYCGNRLTKEQLETLPMAKIDSIMNNQFGDSLSNLGVKPGQSIGFVVAMSNVPKDAADFGVEVLGSTVAGQ